MKKSTKKILSVLLTLAMVVTMLPAFTVTASASSTTVYYVDADGTTKSLDGVTEGQTYTTISDGNKPETWTAGWYVVDGNVKIKKTVTCTGDVRLILKDGTQLTVKVNTNRCAGICVSGEGNSLTVYGQSG